MTKISEVTHFLSPQIMNSAGMYNHVVVKNQVTGDAKASHTLDKLEIYGDAPGRPLDSSHVDLCLILLRC